MAMNEKVKKAFETAFPEAKFEYNDDVLPEHVAGWDSLGHLNLVNALQTEFTVEFQVEEIMKMDSVKAIYGVLSERGLS